MLILPVSITSDVNITGDGNVCKYDVNISGKLYPTLK